MPQHIPSQRRRRKNRAKKPVRRGGARGGARGGKIKASDVLGGISGVSGGIGLAFPPALILSGLTGVAAGIAKLFGAGGVTREQAVALQRAQNRGVVLAMKKRRAPVRKRRRK